MLDSKKILRTAAICSAWPFCAGWCDPVTLPDASPWKLSSNFVCWKQKSWKTPILRPLSGYVLADIVTIGQFCNESCDSRSSDLDQDCDASLKFDLWEQVLWSFGWVLTDTRIFKHINRNAVRQVISETCLLLRWLVILWSGPKGKRSNGWKTIQQLLEIRSWRKQLKRRILQVGQFINLIHQKLYTSNQLGFLVVRNWTACLKWQEEGGYRKKERK